jgi:hypothetical protein
MPNVLSAAAERLRSLLPRRFRRRHPVVAVVRLSGAIGAVMPLRTGLSIAGTAPALERAFSVPDLKAVALVVNSPGVRRRSRTSSSSASARWRRRRRRPSSPSSRMSRPPAAT